nr:ribose 5-phosphate isomerase B [Bacteroidota bacterium]
MIITIGSDHAGFELKDKLKHYLSEKLTTLLVEDVGAFSADSVDYPDYAHEVADQVHLKLCTYGILICGSANGVAIAANKHKGIRAAVCWNVEVAKLARLHNDANIICIPARFVDEQTAFDMAHTFITTLFEGGRHARRVEKIDCV